MTTTPPILEAIGLRRVADDKAVLLEGVSLTIAARSSTAIVGPPGAGKTLLLRALSLLDPLQSGEVRFRGQSIADHDVPSVRRQVILLQQRPVLIEGTVRDNLLLPFTFRQSTERQFDEGRIAELLTVLDRDTAFLGRETRELSGGESQVVALLRAIQLDPAVLLLDEPTSSLDVPTTKAVEQLVQDWRIGDEDRALVVVTHTRDQAARLAQRTIHMESGSIINEGENDKPA